MSGEEDKRLAEFVGERELRQCALCGAMTRNWQEHHFDYQRKPEATVTLCLKCHKLADERRRDREKIEFNKPEPPELPVGLAEPLSHFLLVGLILTVVLGFVSLIIVGGVVYLITLDIWGAGLISSFLTAIICIAGFARLYQERMRKQKEYNAKLVEYDKRLLEWENQQARTES